MPGKGSQLKRQPAHEARKAADEQKNAKNKKPFELTPAMVKRASTKDIELLLRRIDREQ